MDGNSGVGNRLGVDPLGTYRNTLGLGELVGDNKSGDAVGPLGRLAAAGSVDDEWDRDKCGVVDGKFVEGGKGVNDPVR